MVRLDVEFIQTMLYRYYYYGIFPATRTTYSSSQASYFKFCSMIQHYPIPTNESTILLFVTHTSPPRGLSCTTVKAIHNMHVPNSQHIDFNQLLTPQLQQVLRGTQWTQAFSKPPWISRPITLDIMKEILNLLLHKSASYDNTMLWETCCTDFSGFHLK